MDIRQLRYFLAIAEEGQISKAARRLNIAQPPLSQQLKMLEQELGVILIERGARQIRLTDAGRLLQERATKLLEFLSATTSELKDMSSGAKGSLSIGAVASAGASFLPERVRQFHQRYPDVTFQFWEGSTSRILRLLQHGIIEIGITRTVFDPDLFQAIDLPPEQLLAAQSDTLGILPGHDACVSVGDLAAKPLLIHRSNEGIIVECCQRHGFDPRIICRGDDMRTLLAWAAAGIGIAIVPQSVVSLAPSQQLSYLEIADPGLTIRKAVICYKNRYLSAVAKNFMASLLTS